jgi:hypothetical protein
VSAVIDFFRGLPTVIGDAARSDTGFIVLIIASGVAVAALVSGVGLIRRARRQRRADAQRFFR